MAAVFGLLTLLVAGVALIAQLGHIDTSFLNDRFARELESRIGTGTRVTIARSELRWGDAGFAVGLDDITMQTAANDAALAIPQGELALDPWALLRFELVPKGISLAKLDLAFAAREPSPAEMPTGAVPAHNARPLPFSLDRPIALLLAALSPDGGQPFEIAINDIGVTLNQTTGSDPVQITGLSFRTSADAAGRAVLMRWTDPATPSNVLEARVTLLSPSDSAANSILRIEGKDWHARAAGQLLLAAGLSKISQLEEAKGRISLDARLGLSGTGDIASIAAGISLRGFAGPAIMSKSDLAADISATWLKDQPDITLRSIKAELGDLSLNGQGKVTYLAPTGAVRFELASTTVTSAAFAMPAPITLTGVTLDATLSADRKTMSIKTLSASSPSGLSVSGTLDIADLNTPGLALTVRAAPLLVSQAIALWPPGIARETRGFLARTLSEGTLSRFDAQVSLPPADLALALNGKPLPDKAYAISFALRKTSLRNIPDLPALVALDIDGTVTGRTAKLALRKGSIELPDRSVIPLESATFSVSDTSAIIPIAAIDINLTAALGRVRQLIALPAFKPFVADAVLETNAS